MFFITVVDNNGASIYGTRRPKLSMNRCLGKKCEEISHANHLTVLLLGWISKRRTLLTFSTVSVQVYFLSKDLYYDFSVLREYFHKLRDKTVTPAIPARIFASLE